MKIGLVLFGHLRSYRQTLSSFNLLKETIQRTGEVDVFCHSWDIEESVTAAWWKAHKPNDPPPATVNSKEIEEKYAPVRYTIESSIQFEDSSFDIDTSIPIPGILSMLYTQKSSFELLKQYETEKGFRYDVIVKARYDLIYEIAPGFDKIIEDCASGNKIYLPSSNPYELVGSCSDIFAIGSRDEMEKYFSFCSNFKMATEYYQQDGYGQLIPEFCMTVYLDKIGVRRMELSDLRLHILRMNGDKFQINSDKNFEANEPLCFTGQMVSKNKELIPRQPDNFINNILRLVKKYMSWIDGVADEKLLEEYASFYNGQSFDRKSIRRLAEKAKEDKIFTRNVMKFFFEAAMINAKYGPLKKFSLALLLYRQSGYGTFFFRVLKRTIFNK